MTVEGGTLRAGRTPAAADAGAQAAPELPAALRELPEPLLVATVKADGTVRHHVENAGALPPGKHTLRTEVRVEEPIPYVELCPICGQPMHDYDCR